MKNLKLYFGHWNHSPNKCLCHDPVIKPEEKYNIVKKPHIAFLERATSH